MKISIIIPVLNEQTVIVETLQRLQTLRKAGHELIIVDAGSTDNTQKLAAPLADYVLEQKKRGLARQMNTGAKFAHNEILLFLHADTHLAADAKKLIINGLAKSERQWGRFDVRLSGQAFRRWEENGIIRTILLMWSLRLAYALLVSPETLKKYYR